MRRTLPGGAVLGGSSRGGGERVVACRPRAAVLERTHPLSGRPRAVGVEDLPEEWRIVWEERAAILEFEGGLPHEKAEALALDEVVEQARRAGVVL